METDTSATFAWLLYPSKTGTKKINIQTLKAPAGVFKVRLKIPGIPETRITLRLYGNKEIHLSSGNLLDGLCAVTVKGRKPIVAGGVIKNKEGEIIVRDSSASKNVLR